MKILFVTNHFLDSNSGGCFASSAYINAFKKISTDFLLLYPKRDDNDLKFINENVNAVGVKYQRSFIGKIVDIYMGRINRFYDCIIHYVCSFRPDIVVFDNSRASAGYVKKIKELGIYLITIHHNFEIEYYAANKPHFIVRNILNRHIRIAERDAIEYSNLNLTLTTYDIDALSVNYSNGNTNKFELIGVFDFKVSEYCLMPRKPKNISLSNGYPIFVISGSLNSSQTEYSILEYFERYHSSLLEIYPNSQIIITGRMPSKKILSLCDRYPNVFVFANPDNILEIISMADIYLCPISVGGGLKLRIMDALKCGLPVLTHSNSGRGYEVFSEFGCLFTYQDVNSFVVQLTHFKFNNYNPNNIISSFNFYMSFDVGVSRLMFILNKHFIRP